MVSKLPTSKANKAISLGVSAVIVIVIILIVGFGVYLNDTFNTTSTTTPPALTFANGSSSSSSSSTLSNLVSQPTQSSTSSTDATITNYTCIFPGQSFGLSFRVLSDATLKPVAGANVTALYTFPGIGSCSNYTSGKTSSTFTTNSTEWYSLQGLNDGNYSLDVNYSALNYVLTAQLASSTYTCATLYVPSGNTNVTNSPTPCPANTSITSQTSSATNDTINTSGETCIHMNTGNQTSVTETYLCHTASTISSNSSSSNGE